MTIQGVVALVIVGIIVALFGTVLWYRADLATAQANLATSEQSLKIAGALNGEKDKTIQLQVDRAKVTEDILRDVRKDIDAITQTTAETAKSINDLGDTNPDVKSFLLTKLPPELDRLLNNKAH